MKQITPLQWERAKKPANDAPYSSLAQARAAAAQEFGEIIRNRTAHVKSSKANYSYMYADLADVFGAVTQPLAAWGITVSQWPEASEKGWFCITELYHESGEAKAYSYPIKPMQGRGLDDAMSFQSAFQLAKRYGLTGALGISTEESVEGNVRSGPIPKINEGDGLRMPHGAKFNVKDSPDKKARAAADAIIAQFQTPKTQVGLDGVYNRNQMFIDQFQDKYPELYSDVFDAYALAGDRVAEEKASEE